MTEPVTQLYPLPTCELSLEGLYMKHNLRQFRDKLDRAYVFSNFVVSLDGRIAVPHLTKPGMTVPKQIANPRDWRLFQELAVQSDLLVSSGRYLRDYADGKAQDILEVYDDPKFSDLRDWRVSQGLSPQPDLLVISASLAFSIPDILTRGDRSLIVVTNGKADPKRIKKLEAQNAKVIVAGKNKVNGQLMIDLLTELGYRLIYSVTGPLVLHLLASSGVLDRLYLTFANRLLGADPFSPIIEGPLLEPPVDFVMNTMYFDPHGVDGLGQLFVSYDAVRGQY